MSLLDEHAMVLVTGISAAGKSTVAQLLVSAYVEAIASRPLHVVVLCPRVDVVEAREAARAKRGYRPGMDSALALDHAHRTETPRIGLWLDSSDLTPVETVAAVLARATEARV